MQLDRSAAARLDRWRIAPTLLAAAIVAVYLVLDVRSTDLAAHLFRAELFEQEGFTAWNGQWYGGHHTPAYSVLFPPLAALIGPSLAGGAALVAAAALFESLVHHRYGERARWAALWFGGTVGVMAFTGRMPFALGLALGLAALVALQRGRRLTSIVLALGCALASPVAGLFLALGGVAYELSGLLPGARRGESHRGAGALVVLGAFVPPVLLALFFPEGGWQPFALSSLYPVPIAVVALLFLLPREEATLRIGVALYGVATLAAFAIPTPMGSNAVRLGELFAGPLLLLALTARPRAVHVPRAAAAVALLLAAAWAVASPQRDLRKAVGDPSVESGYYDPLLNFLESRGDGPWRVEALFTKNPFEAAEIAPQFALARGWQRQLDVERNPLFYNRGLFTPLTYGLWLSEHGVRYVAVPDVEPDTSSKLERALIDSGQARYLELTFQSAHWRVYEVELPNRIAVPEDGTQVTLVGLRPEEFSLRFAGSGSARVRVGWTPYWHADEACVERAGRWTRVTAQRAGVVRVTIRVTPDRLLARGRRCD